MSDMKKDESSSISKQNHSIEAILGIMPTKRSPTKIRKSFIPYRERSAGKSTIDFTSLAMNKLMLIIFGKFFTIS